MYRNIVILILISWNKIQIGQQLYSEPDLSNPLIPLRWRQLCGYRYRPQQMNITFNKKCFMRSFEDRVVFVSFAQERENITVPVNRILGGRDVEYRESPWTVQLAIAKYDGSKKLTHYETKCTGVLITMKDILTAAHCQPKSGIKMFVFGGRDTTFSGQSISDFTFIPNPNSTTVLENGTRVINYDKDIAVIRLHTPFDWINVESPEINPFNKHFQINTICLPQMEDFTSGDIVSNQLEDAFFFGWGFMLNNRRPQRLQRGHVLVKYCDGEMKECFITPKEYPGGHNNIYSLGCGGDSGSGLTQYLDDGRAILIGIQINIVIEVNPDEGFMCTREDVVQAKFIRVVRHIDWIYQQLKSEK